MLISTGCPAAVDAETGAGGAGTEIAQQENAGIGNLLLAGELFHRDHVHDKF